MNTTHSVALVDSASNMTSRGSASAGSNGKSTVTADTQPSPGFFKRYGLVFAVAALGIICLMPQLADLSIAGQRMIGIMAFAVITWATGAVSFPVSAGVIMALIAVLVGLSPQPDGQGLIGTSKALRMALTGFSSPAFCLVGAALFLAAAMMQTGLTAELHSLRSPKSARRLRALCSASFSAASFSLSSCRRPLRALPASCRSSPAWCAPSDFR